MANELKSESVIELLKRFLETDEGIALMKKINLVYQFNIAPKKIGFDEVSYTIDLKKGEVKKGAYEGGKPDATFFLKDEDFFKLAMGKLNPQIAFMRGALKIKGSLAAAQKFTPDIFPKPSKLGFKWESSNKAGGWYNSLKNLVADLADAGVTNVSWLPTSSQSTAQLGYFP